MVGERGDNGSSSVRSSPSFCCCIAEGDLFTGDATRRKIRCLHEILRGVTGVPPALRDSLLQVDEVLFLPSPSLHCSLEFCLSRGDRSPWAFPSCKFSFLLELEGGWLNVWARLRNCGESESSSGKVCQAEDSGEAGGVPGGEPPGEKSFSEARLLDRSKLSTLPSRPLILLAPLEKIFSKEEVKDLFALFFRTSSLNLPLLVEFSGIILFEII